MNDSKTILDRVNPAELRLLGVHLLEPDGEVIRACQRTGDVFRDHENAKYAFQHPEEFERILIDAVLSPGKESEDITHLRNGESVHVLANYLKPAHIVVVAVSSWVDKCLVNDADRKIISKYMSGKTREEIAIEMEMDIEALKYSVRKLLEKLNFRSIPQLVVWGCRIGIEES